MSSAVPPGALLETLLSPGSAEAENVGNQRGPPLVSVIADRRAALAALASAGASNAGNESSSASTTAKPSAGAGTKSALSLALPPLRRRASLAAPSNAGAGASGSASSSSNSTAAGTNPQQQKELLKNFRLLKHANMLKAKAAKALSGKHLTDVIEALAAQALMEAQAAGLAVEYNNGAGLLNPDPLSLTVSVAGFRRVCREHRWLAKLVKPTTFAQLQTATMVASSSFSPAATGDGLSPAANAGNGSPSAASISSSGAVSLKLLARYIRSGIYLSNVSRRLSSYDSEGDGCLREHDLENYVFEAIPELISAANANGGNNAANGNGGNNNSSNKASNELATLQDNFYPFYVFTAVRKFFFNLDTHRLGKVKIADVLSSPILSEWLCLFPPDHPHLIGPGPAPKEGEGEGKGKGEAEEESAEEEEAGEIAAGAGNEGDRGDAEDKRKDKKRHSKKAATTTSSPSPTVPSPTVPPPTVPPFVLEAAKQAAKDVLFSLDAARRVVTTTTTTTTEVPSGDVHDGGGSNADGSDNSSAATATTTTITTTTYVPATLPVDEAQGIGLTNWFSAATAIRVYSQYLDLDQDQNGLLSPLELSRACNGTLSDAFIHRLFLASNTYGGEIDFKAYLDFVLATEYRRTQAAMRYTFRALDTPKGKGFLSLSDIRFFFSDVASKMVAAGHESVDAANVSDEILDMCRPPATALPASTTRATATGAGRGDSKRRGGMGSGGKGEGEGGITLDDLLRCGVGHTVLQILTDAAGFWQYDNREWLVQQQQQQLQQMQQATAATAANANTNAGSIAGNSGNNSPDTSATSDNNHQHSAGLSSPPLPSEDGGNGGEGPASPVSPTGPRTDEFREYCPPAADGGSDGDTIGLPAGTSASSSWGDDDGGGARAFSSSASSSSSSSSSSSFGEQQYDDDGAAAAWGEPARPSSSSSSSNAASSSAAGEASSEWPPSPPEEEKEKRGPKRHDGSGQEAHQEEQAEAEAEGLAIEDKAAEIGFE